jgi:hypothetical protein
MKKILSLFMLWQCIAITSFASTDDIGLYVNDIILDWSGGGGTKDVVNNSLTSNQSAINYWDIHDLSTDIYEKLEISFAR